MKATQVGKLVASLLLPICVGGIAGMFTTEAIPGWYASLNQPSFNPPNWVFGPVTMLYILMGISLYLVWKQEAGKQRNQAILIFMLQLILNFGWSFLFFYFNLIGIALIEIIALWIMIVLMLIKFRRIKPLAAYLNIPYLLWVSFATALNAAYFILN
ncbi:MAG: tryptophan-rich sensory protein [Bacteroidales bacterium]|nr:tryptophan-rich sensory protein [Bacteroidales bacterium]